jgi:hypothetical protein
MVLGARSHMNHRNGRRFKTGKLYFTRGVNDRVADDEAFAKFVLESLRRHARGDWGDLCQQDKEENNSSLDKNLRLFSSYVDPDTGEKIWIITEADRSATTVLLPTEY